MVDPSETTSDAPGPEERAEPRPGTTAWFLRTKAGNLVGMGSLLGLALAWAWATGEVPPRLTLGRFLAMAVAVLAVWGMFVLYGLFWAGPGRQAVAGGTFAYFLAGGLYLSLRTDAAQLWGSVQTVLFWPFFVLWADVCQFAPWGCIAVA